MAVSRERHREYELQRFHKRKAEMFAYLGGQCVVCGTDESLQIDHVDPSTKLFSITKNWSIAWARLVVELDKCQLLCKTHHDVKSSTEVQVEHGGGKCGKRGCKCEPCMKRKAEYMKEYNFIRIR